MDEARAVILGERKLARRRRNVLPFRLVKLPGIDLVACVVLALGPFRIFGCGLFLLFGRSGFRLRSSSFFFR